MPPVPLSTDHHLPLVLTALVVHQLIYIYKNNQPWPTLWYVLKCFARSTEATLGREDDNADSHFPISYRDTDLSTTHNSLMVRY